MKKKDSTVKNLPKILLIGAGHFGKNHLRVLKKLETDGKIILAGIVVKTKKSRKELKKSEKVPVYLGFRTKILKQVDGVDIVTPYKTHYALVKKSLRYTHVFVEKPLTDSFQKAKRLHDLSRKNGKILMVGHIYRFHPLIKVLMQLLKSEQNRPVTISGKFISPDSTFRGDDPLFELLHFFDILDNLFQKRPQTVWCRGNKHLSRVDLRYPGLVDTHLLLGWREEEKKRTLDFITAKKKIHCDFANNEIAITRNNKTTHRVFPLKEEPLEKELLVYVRLLSGENCSYPDSNLGLKIVKIAERARLSRVKKRSRVAIIGGGIFGVTCALFLSKDYSVTLFEKNADLLQEATLNNQYRHHWGYHYPRSPETIAEIQADRKDFEKFYQEVIEDVPSYYCLAKKGSLISIKEFSTICRKHYLPFVKGYPPKELFNRQSASFCLKVPEGIYNYQKLKKFIKEKIRNRPKLIVKTNHRVVNAMMNDKGQKILRLKAFDRLKEEKFDWVVNATYARYNVFCDWLGFARKNLKFRLKEIIIVSAKTKNRCSILVGVGPYATITPTSIKGNQFTVGDVPLSVLSTISGIKSAAINDKRWGKYQTQWKEVKKRCRQWYPFLDRAKYVRSMFVILPTELSTEKTAARPTEVVSHGFGCWSIFSGKILASVNAAKKILEEIKPQS